MYMYMYMYMHVLLKNCTEHSDVILYVKRPILLSCDLMILFFVLKVP